MRYWTTLLGLATFAAAAPAVAQPIGASPQATGEALLLKPLTLTKLSDLHFGTIVPSNLAGIVTVSATGAAPLVVGGISLVASDPPHRARFAGGGTSGRQVIISAANPGTLTNLSGDTLTVLALTLDGPNIRTIDATRTFFFGVGGVLLVGANQPEGLYKSDFDVTANYL